MYDDFGCLILSFPEYFAHRFIRGNAVIMCQWFFHIKIEWLNSASGQRSLNDSGVSKRGRGAPRHSRRKIYMWRVPLLRSPALVEVWSSQMKLKLAGDRKTFSYSGESCGEKYDSVPRCKSHWALSKELLALKKSFIFRKYFFIFPLLPDYWVRFMKLTYTGRIEPQAENLPNTLF